MLTNLLTCLRRGHQPVFLRNVYGDEILLLNARSVWYCARCSSLLYRQELHHPDRLEKTENAPVQDQQPEYAEHSTADQALDVTQPAQNVNIEHDGKG